MYVHPLSVVSTATPSGFFYRHAMKLCCSSHHSIWEIKIADLWVHALPNYTGEVSKDFTRTHPENYTLNSANISSNPCSPASVPGLFCIVVFNHQSTNISHLASQTSLIGRVTVLSLECVFRYRQGFDFLSEAYGNATTSLSVVLHRNFRK
jgi:hypothetical protein